MWIRMRQNWGNADGSSKDFWTINKFTVSMIRSVGFSKTSLKLMQNLLCNRHQRSSVNDSISNWTENRDWTEPWSTAKSHGSLSV